MNSSSFPFSLLITLLALILVLALAWFTLKFLAGLSRHRLQAGRIQIIQSQSVGSRERLVLAKIDGKDYVLGVTAGNISVIDRLGDSLEGHVESTLEK